MKLTFFLSIIQLYLYINSCFGSSSTVKLRNPPFPQLSPGSQRSFAEFSSQVAGTLRSRVIVAGGRRPALVGEQAYTLEHMPPQAYVDSIDALTLESTSLLLPTPLYGVACSGSAQFDAAICCGGSDNNGVLTDRCFHTLGTKAPELNEIGSMSLRRGSFAMTTVHTYTMICGGVTYFNGTGSLQAVNQCDVFDIRTGQLIRQMDDILQEPRFGVVGVSVNRKAIFFGGIKNSNVLESASHYEIYDKDTDQWSFGTILGARRMLASGVSINNRAVFCGGILYEGSATAAIKTDCDIYHEPSNTWMLVHMAVPRWMHAAIGVGDHVVMAMGTLALPPALLQIGASVDVLRFDDVAGSVTQYNFTIADEYATFGCTGAGFGWPIDVALVIGGSRYDVNAARFEAVATVLAFDLPSSAPTTTTTSNTVASSNTHTSATSTTVSSGGGGAATSTMMAAAGTADAITTTSSAASLSDNDALSPAVLAVLIGVLVACCLLAITAVIFFVLRRSRRAVPMRRPASRRMSAMHGGTHSVGGRHSQRASRRLGRSSHRYSEAYHRPVSSSFNVDSTLPSSSSPSVTSSTYQLVPRAAAAAAAANNAYRAVPSSVVHDTEHQYLPLHMRKAGANDGSASVYGAVPAGGAGAPTSLYGAAPPKVFTLQRNGAKSPGPSDYVNVPQPYYAPAPIQ